jgi:hypothetical protein
MSKTNLSPTSERVDVPTALSLTAATQIDLEAAGDTGGAPALPRFRMVGYTGGPMRVAGWRYPVILDLAGLAIPSQSRPIRFSHDPTAGVGHTDVIRVEGGQLVATGIISRDTTAAREVVVSSKNGFPWQASVGASVEEFEFVKEGQTVIVNGRTFSGPVNVVRKSTLGEISFVDLGADGATSANVTATAVPNQGVSTVDPASSTVQEEPVVSATTPATERVPAPTANPPASNSPAANPPVEEMRAQAAAETDRIAAVRRICAGRLPRIEAQAIREGWDAQRTELEVLRGTRPEAPAVHIRDNAVTGTVLEAACLMTAGLSQLDQVY